MKDTFTVSARLDPTLVYRTPATLSAIKMLVIGNAGMVRRVVRSWPA
jgi:hypothetical protein